MFEPEVFRKQMYCIEERFVALLGLFGRPGNCAPFASSVVAPLLASELINENSKLYTNEKSSYLTNNTVPSGGPRSNCGSFSTFYWAAQLCLWAVFAVPVAWDQT